MRELWHTGWMHNRVRMVAASFLVKHLLIPWQEGAAWFWDTLVDADLANNTLGWQWVAGCGADAAPYFRVFNPAVQAAKFDPQRTYVGRWAPEGRAPIVNHEDARRCALAALASIKK
jgi:deoxyribodipyrimidine photo-lyase